MNKNPIPQWQPIEKLPLIAHHIDEGLALATEHYETLLETKTKPYVLDNTTVERIIKVFTNQQDDSWLFDEQLQRWMQGQLTLTQKKEVERLQLQMEKWQRTI